MIPIYAIHRDPKWWGDDAELFRPERWLKADKSEQRRKAFMPFGDGPRSCPGATFALQEAKLAIFRLLQQFNIELDTPEVSWPFSVPGQARRCCLYRLCSTQYGYHCSYTASSGRSAWDRYLLSSSFWMIPASEHHFNGDIIVNDNRRTCHWWEQYTCNNCWSCVLPGLLCETRDILKCCTNACADIGMRQVPLKFRHSATMAVKGGVWVKVQERKCRECTIWSEAIFYPIFLALAVTLSALSVWRSWSICCTIFFSRFFFVHFELFLWLAKAYFDSLLVDVGLLSVSSDLDKPPAMWLPHLLVYYQSKLIANFTHRNNDVSLFWSWL